MATPGRTVLLLAALAACSREPAAPAPGLSAVLITLDTTRYDALGTNGSPVATPALDALAKESVVYDRCRSVAPLTLPSHTSMLTGLYPLRHGLRVNGAGRLPDEAVTLAEVARGAGLETAAFIASAVLDRRFGLDQGFDVYDQPERPEVATSLHFAERPARAVAAQAVRWIDSRGPAARFFVWIHLFDPHAPYQPSAEDLARAGGDAYRGEVLAADRAVGEVMDLLRRRRLVERTIVVVVADHGEDLGDHGEPSHASFCYDTTLHVPLLVRHPDGRRAGERSRAIASVVDVFPTIVEALGLADPGGEDGVSLWDGDPPEGRGVYFETYYDYVNYGWGQLAGWADAGGKYIHSAEPELYDTERDPMERVNRLSGADDAAAEPYRAAIAALERREKLPVGRSVGGDERTIAELQSLGYAAGATAEELPGPLEETGRPVPAERLGELASFLRASDLADAGRCEEALPVFREVVAGNPGNRIALDRLAQCLLGARRVEEAIGVLEQRVRCGEAGAPTYINLGVAYQGAGRFEEAIEEYRRGLEIDPGHRTGRENLARLLEGLGRSAEAEEVRAGR
jgi:arylsulfatase A-like enzyme